ncbi:MAG: hypothetical protein ABI175_06000 [Polyangiales bacterium]
MASRVSRFFVLTLGVVGAAALADHAGVAQAADPEGSGVDCVVKGRGVVDKTVSIFTDRTGGSAVASFATQEVSLEVYDFPAASSGRARVRTGKGSGSLRIEGFVDAAKLPLAARNDLPLASDHVWIGKGQPVRLEGASKGSLAVGTTLAATQQKLHAKAACSAVAIGAVLGDDLGPPASAKKWLLKSTTLDLYGDPSGAIVFTLQVPYAESGILLYSTESQSIFQHVRHWGPIVIDAWAKTSELKPLPKGEMIDELAGPGAITINPAKLKVEGGVKELKAPKSLPVRLAANDAAKPIGTLEDGAEVLVLDTVAGWSRIYPKGLELLPPEGKDFWVKAADLGVK